MFQCLISGWVNVKAVLAKICQYHGEPDIDVERLCKNMENLLLTTCETEVQTAIDYQSENKENNIINTCVGIDPVNDSESSAKTETPEGPTIMKSIVDELCNTGCYLEKVESKCVLMYFNCMQRKDNLLRLVEVLENGLHEQRLQLLKYGIVLDLVVDKHQFNQMWMYLACKEVGKC